MKVVKTFPSKNSSRCVYANLFGTCAKNTPLKLGAKENSKLFIHTHTQTQNTPSQVLLLTSFTQLLLVQQEPRSLLLKIIIANHRDIFPDYTDSKLVQF